MVVKASDQGFESSFIINASFKAGAAPVEEDEIVVEAPIEEEAEDEEA